PPPPCSTLFPYTTLFRSVLVPARADLPRPEKFDDAGFVSVFDGETLKGWKVSAKTGHSRTSKNTSGGKWVVEKGAIIGSQDVPRSEEHTSELQSRSDLVC